MKINSPNSVPFGQIKQYIKNKQKHFRYSLKQLNILVFVFLFLVSSVIIASISTYYNNHLRTQFYHEAMNLLTLYNNNVSADLSTLDTYLFQLGTYNTDMSIVNTTEDTLKIYNARARVHKILTESLPTFSGINGLYFYSLAADAYIYSLNNNSTAECAVYIREFLRENRSQMSGVNRIYSQWVLYRTQDNSYFIRFLPLGNSVLGAWTSIPTLTSMFDNVLYPDSRIFYTDKEGKLINNGEFTDYIFQPEDSLDHYQLYTDKAAKSQYLVAADKVPYCDSYILAFIPLTNISNLMQPVYQNLALIILFIFIAVLLLAIAYKKTMNIPLRSLEKVLDGIHDGTDNALILTDNSNCLEVIEINRSFNNMIQKIQDLKINIYEEQLTKSRIELQYLKAQVSPHFLINCLSTLSSLATANDPDGNNRGLQRKMAQTLSDHLRYTLSFRDKVALKVEAAYVENYLELTSLRYPYSLAYSINIPEELQNAAVFPMILLMLTENTIKHNMVMGKKLIVTINAAAEETSGGTGIHLIHIDSGSGFEPDALELNNHILEHPEICETGHSIGIYNIAKSLQLVYEDEARLIFSNEPGMGARIDIHIPYVVYTNEGD